MVIFFVAVLSTHTNILYYNYIILEIEKNKLR